jgi:hypothetical protein
MERGHPARNERGAFEKSRLKAGLKIEVKELFFMYKTFSVILTCLLAMIAFACAGGGTGNSANSANTVTITNLDANHMPAGLSTSPLPINGTTPGIPAANAVNINLNRPGATPIPGIDPGNIKIAPNPKGTPTPGIPSPAEIKKMMQQQSGNSAASMEANTPSQGNVRPRDSMKQMQMRKKPQ